MKITGKIHLQVSGEPSGSWIQVDFTVTPVDHVIGLFRSLADSLTLEADTEDRETKV